MKLISIADMLKKMEERDQMGELIPFSIEWVTCDRKQGIGGEKISLKKAVLVGSGKSKSKAKNPNHFDNYTRNIRPFDGDRIMKIHPHLVTKFNGLAITL